MVEQEIRDFLAANFLLGADPTTLESSSSLIEAGLIDSTGVLELVGFLEDQFDIRIQDDDLTPENFDSIDNILGYLARKRAEAV
jgi:acyl carrier protein